MTPHLHIKSMNMIDSRFLYLCSEAISRLTKCQPSQQCENENASFDHNLQSASYTA